MSTIHVAHQRSLRQSQAGMVSIMVTMVLMIVISLIVIGFAQISRRNQRQALDRQLSTQAFYAAESGVNDVRNLIQTRLKNGLTVEAKTGCKTDGATHTYSALVGSSSNVLDPPTGLIKYTCLLVDPTPTALDLTNVSDSASSILPLKASSGVINTLTLKWHSKTGSATPTAGCPASVAFPATSGWGCGYGVLRFDLVPTDGGALSVAGLEQTTMTSFIVPLTTGGIPTLPFLPSATNVNNRVGTKCTNTECTATITGLSANSYYIRLSSIYQDASLEITGAGSAGTVHFVGAQAVVDATGKANDVLRRIQVHVALQSQSKTQLPDYAIESTDSVCKRFAVSNGYFDSQIPSSLSADNPLCQP